MEGRRIRPVKDIVRPDGFAIGLFLLGIVLLFVPLMVMPGLAAIVSAFAYWLTMMVVKVMHRRRS
jgi:hypothetical protein